MSQIIKLEAVTLKKQRILSSELYEVELGDKLVTLRLIFVAEEPKNDDESLEWQEVLNHATVIWIRDRISSLKMVRVQEVKVWQIIGSFSGTAEDMYLFFKKQRDCEAVFEQLREYFFGKKA